MFKSNVNPMFRSKFAEDIFNQKYAHEGSETWATLARTLVTDVCGGCLTKDEQDTLTKYITELKFIPGGRYLYYAGRTAKFFNNCFLLRAEEDTREDWADLSWKSESCLMTGGGIGIDYSVYRPKGSPLGRTGGLASGPLPKMEMINEIGRRVMQGGSRRSAIYASLNWQHGDIEDFLTIKDWKRYKVPGTDLTLFDLKQLDFNWPAPLDTTNISVNYDTAWLLNYWKTGDVGEVFKKNVAEALKTAEPGFSFNFFDKERETLRNAPVSANTWVLTEDGYRQVRDMVDELVVVWTGKQWAPTTFRKTKTLTPVVKVQMTGGREIVADPEHEFLVERYKGKGKRRTLTTIERVPAGALQAGDIVHVSYPDVAGNQRGFDPNWYLRGFVYGDGSFSKYGAEVTFCTDDKKACATAIGVEQLDGVRSVTESDARGYKRVYLNDPWYHDRTKAFMPTDLDMSDYASFLAGVFDADGSYDATQHRVRLSSVERTFLEDVRRALEVLGIQASVNTGSNSGYGGRKSWTLVVAAEFVTQFANLIPCIRLKPIDHEAYRPSMVKVLSVSEAGIEDVFCCDVGVEEHSFMAEGVIISNCTEVTSEDDSDVCNLGSINMGRVENIAEFQEIVALATKFLLAGTTKADLPYDKVYHVRNKNRRLGLGLMGMHEWLIQRGSRYEVTPELHRWLMVYKAVSDKVAFDTADRWGINRPVGRRAIAPTGTIGILAGTTTGVEPLFAVAYKRRYLKDGTDWHYQYVVDSAAQELIDFYGADPEKIESALDLAADYERRMAFQADVQDYVDQSISSTINLPAYGTELNNDWTVDGFANTLAKYAHRLRGFTVYPDGARGGQPLTAVPYAEAKEKLGQVFVETHDICSISGKGGTCGI